MSTDVHTLSGAYALDALSPEEAAEFRRHIDQCPSCFEEVRELQQAAARMGGAQAVIPPPELKARILSAADRTPQEPPARGGSQRGERTQERRRWSAWLAMAAAAVVVVGGGVVGLQALDEEEPTLPVAVSEVFEAPDARTATVSTANGGKLTVGVSQSRQEMAVDTRDLPELGSGEVYQLWSVHGSETVSVGVLEDLDDGASMGLPEEDTTVAVTVEPQGGSEQPTGEPIVQVDPREV